MLMKTIHDNRTINRYVKGTLSDVLDFKEYNVVTSWLDYKVRVVIK